jgi:hypothetical protein
VSSFLAQHFDPALEVEGSIAVFTDEERIRLGKLHAVARDAANITRRKGPDASGEELSHDKKMCKRIAHVASQCLAAWGGPTRLPDTTAREAAIVDWPKWWADHQVWLRNRMRTLATWGIKNDEERWAKSAIVRLENELGWLSYSFRD